MLNGHHLALLTFSTTPDGESREFLVQVLPIKRLFRFQCWGIEKLAALGDFGSSFAIGQYPETPDADKSSGQDMEQKAANELIGFQSHDAGIGARSVFATSVVLPEETNVTVLQLEEPTVGDGHPVGVSTKIVYDLLGPTKRALGLNPPPVFENCPK